MDDAEQALKTINILVEEIRLRFVNDPIFKLDRRVFGTQPRHVMVRAPWRFHNDPDEAPDTYCLIFDYCGPLLQVKGAIDPETMRALSAKVSYLMNQGTPNERWVWIPVTEDAEDTLIKFANLYPFTKDPSVDELV